jgi:pimeloyl-ACP methyl ester carboxylesterase
MMVEDLEALRQHLGLTTFTLIGHSHGGYIGLNYAIAHGDRLAQLILVDPQVGWPEVDAALQRNLPKLAVQERYGEAVGVWQSERPLTSDADFAAWLRGVMPLYFHNPAYGESLVQVLHHHHPSVAALRATQATDQQFPVRGRVTQLHMPTLVLVGRHDFITSPEQAAILTEFGANLHIFEHSGHFPWIEESDAFFNTVQAWLTQQEVDQLTV